MLFRSEHIYKYEVSSFSSCDLNKHELEDAEEFQNRTTLTGNYCWKLRCCLLHNGTLDIDEIWSDKDKKEFVDFKFTVSKGTQCGYGGSASIATCPYKTEKKIDIELDLVIFCKKIINIFKNEYLVDDKFIKETENKSLKFFDLRIV